jgi:hypothetical protein
MDFVQTFRICFDNVISDHGQRTFDSYEQKNVTFLDRSFEQFESLFLPHQTVDM